MKLTKKHQENEGDIKSRTFREKNHINNSFREVKEDSVSMKQQRVVG